MLYDPKQAARVKIAQWVAALRSGKYKQGQLFLNYGGARCVLGVMADALGIEHNETSMIVDGLEAGYAPARELIGPLVEQVYCLNDRGVPFDEIATFIEENA